MSLVKENQLETRKKNKVREETTTPSKKRIRGILPVK